MNKKRTTIVHTAIASDQGAHAEGQVGLCRRPIYDVWRGRFREADT